MHAKIIQEKVDIDRSKLVDGFAFVQKKLITLLPVAKKKKYLPRFWCSLNMNNAGDPPKQKKKVECYMSFDHARCHAAISAAEISKFSVVSR